MKIYPVVMTIAGSDSGGGAGIQADLKTISALGAFAATVITAITAQNTQHVEAIHPVPSCFIKKQFDAVMSDINVNAIKTGMLHSADAIATVAKCIDKYDVKNFVLDPVMVATSGDRLIEGETVGELIFVLFPLAKIITPNIDEAELILNRKITTLDDMLTAARDMLDTKCHAVLLKGGHLDTGDKVYDVYQTADSSTQTIISSERIDTSNVHGTGCTVSAAIATYLALGKSLDEAVALGRNYVAEAIKAGKDYKLGNGNGPLNHFFEPQKMQRIDTGS